MHKYNVEEEIDFYKELNEVEEKFLDKDICLITKQPLFENSIKFSCGHTFNYSAIFNEVFKQKYALALYSNVKTKTFVCPYCREPQNQLLPYYPEYNFQQILGINTDDPNFSLVRDKYNNLVYAHTIMYCKGSCVFQLGETGCLNTSVLTHKPTNKTYCCMHMKQIKKQFIVEEKLKQKMELKAKVDLEKKKLAEEKKKLAEENKKVIPTCVQLLKSGKNKGMPCGCKAFKDNLCKKHGSFNEIII